MNSGMGDSRDQTGTVLLQNPADSAGRPQEAHGAGGGEACGHSTLPVFIL